MNKLISVILLAFITSVGSQAATKSVRLPTAADGEVELLIDTDTKLPLAASDGRAKVVLAAFAFVPTKPGESLSVTWTYAVEFSENAKVRSVTIEDERDETLRLLVQDSSPSLKNRVWSGQQMSEVLTEKLLDDMNSKELWILLRRITIVYDDGAKSTLHQLILQSPSMRRGLISSVMQQMKNNPK